MRANSRNARASKPARCDHPRAIRSRAQYARARSIIAQSRGAPIRNQRGHVLAARQLDSAQCASARSSQCVSARSPRQREWCAAPAARVSLQMRQRCNKRARARVYTHNRCRHARGPRKGRCFARCAARRRRHPAHGALIAHARVARADGSAAWPSNGRQRAGGAIQSARDSRRSACGAHIQACVRLPTKRQSVAMRRSVGAPPTSARSMH